VDGYGEGDYTVFAKDESGSDYVDRKMNIEA